MYKSSTFKKVADLENALVNNKECMDYFNQAGNVTEAARYSAICDKLKKELATAKKDHQMSKDDLVYSC